MEGAAVSGLVAEVEVEGSEKIDEASFGVAAGIGEGLGAVGEPMTLRHGVEEDGFGDGGGLMFGGEIGF